VKLEDEKELMSGRGAWSIPAAPRRSAARLLFQRRSYDTRESKETPGGDEMNTFRTEKALHSLCHIHHVPHSIVTVVISYIHVDILLSLTSFFIFILLYCNYMYEFTKKANQDDSDI